MNNLSIQKQTRVLSVKKQTSVLKTIITKGTNLVIVKSAYLNSDPYLTKSRVCSICGTSSDVISM
jgi:hypothetical protein